MQRYLLFDSGCSTCSELARLIASESNGWLEIRSLREAAMQELLNRTRSHWKWEPTLVFVEEERVRVFTGLQLRLQIARGLGLRRSGRIARMVSRFSAQPTTDVSRRRQFLGIGGAILGSLTLGLGLSLPKRSLSASETSLSANATLLAPTDPIIAKLKTTRHLRLASKNFGTPDWKQVFRFTHGVDKKTGYAVALTNASTGVLNTFLLFSREPQTRKVGSTTKKKTAIKALVFRMTKDTASGPKVEWFTPSASPVISATLGTNGQLVNQQTHEATATMAYTSFKCTFLCGALTLGCRADCTACSVVPVPADCGVCIVCVGAAGIACYDCETEGEGDSGTNFGVYYSSTWGDSGGDSGGDGGGSGTLYMPYG